MIWKTLVTVILPSTTCSWS